ncbi:sigma-54 dependent transcriptional regulator [Xanthomonas translucens pv. translucens]|uniref:sigma-54-dependent transcriptional regulator n=1 Tax=Xanthomonas campestris pv. translucens TaxID=343 RepID=UPI0019D67533|nr:sigma-54 dependent transcriptional regulator [Xanthomonas translucens]MCT8286684.1 sigma-54 dependent transcriptional regulator [Xanthomonas translucens pv. translucens]MCT8304342.1 sigma-54 dependent transcriptional regulator [Xanthomonas translucens pv. translucens]QSQ31292.1 sigma-54-dependent Fis family transcriptional regulator [Xanthomonas translucens pv. translucens]UNT97973.1 sigma-54-dependent Fis family transcriptional regulator [Xanthomonas translucens pv. translucens]UNU10583.1 
MPCILIIDDNPAVATALEVLFSLHDIETVHADSPAAGLQRLAEGDIDLVLQDMNFSADTTSGEEGVALFDAIRARHPDLPLILLTAWTQLSSAVELVKAGAADYLAKPWDDRKLLTTVNNLLELSEARRELERRRDGERCHRQQLAQRYDLRGAVFADPASERAIALACQVARSELPVLITGPNGSGKEKIAEIVQANSPMRQGPFVALNCGAIPAELIEAELFGAEAGAYTGANKVREGKFEAADGGTLFLDEIGNLSLAGQMKLLRVLETGRFERLGSNRERQVKVRVISATNADLPTMIRDGAFREDLYYRLNAVELSLPALADRPGDILPLAEHFLSGTKALSAGAVQALQRHAWPGNVRELRNVIQRAELLAGCRHIEAADLNLPKPAPQRPAAGAEPDRERIVAVLGRANGVIAQAAAELGMSRQALYRRMDRYGIPRE